MSKNLIIGVVAVLVLAAGAGAFVLTRNGDDASKASSSPTSANSTTTEQAPAPQSINTLTSAGKAVRCEFTYEGPNGNSEAIMHSDGKGNGRIDMEFKSERDNAGNMTQIIKDEVSYTIVETAGQKVGYKLALDKVKPSESAASSSSQGVPTDTKFDMSCSDWSVDSSKFKVPSDVQFIAI